MNVSIHTCRFSRYHRMPCWLPPLMIIFLFAFCSSCRTKSKIIGIKIYELNDSPEKLCKQWKEAGINTAFIGKELALNSAFRITLRKNRIPYFIIWPVFENSVALQHDSTLYAITSQGIKAKDDWVGFVCPSRVSYRKQQLDSLSWFARNCSPNGFSIDFIRQFVYWEMIYPGRDPATIGNACYCDSCLDRFTAETRISLPDSCVLVKEKAHFLNGRYPVEWNSFRCSLITSMVKDISGALKKINPGIKINLHLVPWREGDFDQGMIRVAAQDIRSLSAYADYLSPMCYSQMLKRDSYWISTVVEDMQGKAPGKILPSIQVYPYYINNSFPVDSLERCLNEALKPPSEGVIFWSWPLLAKDPQRITKIAEYLKDHNFK